MRKSHHNRKYVDNQYIHVAFVCVQDWLIQKLDNQEMPDILAWYNKDEGLFKIKWLHKATDSWEVMADGVLFKQWCIHTGNSAAMIIVPLLCLWLYSELSSLICHMLWVQSF